MAEVKKERRRKKRERDGKLACLPPSIFSALSRLNWGQQGVGSDVSESPWQPIPQPPVCTHTGCPRLVYGLHLWPDCICYGHRQFMTHFSSYFFLFRRCCSYLFPPVSALASLEPKDCISHNPPKDYISHNPPVGSLWFYNAPKKFFCLLLVQLTPLKWTKSAS